LKIKLRFYYAAAALLGIFIIVAGYVGQLDTGYTPECVWPVGATTEGSDGKLYPREVCRGDDDYEQWQNKPEIRVSDRYKPIEN